MVIKKELKQLTDYHTFIMLDSEEIIPTVYQKVPYYMVFDVNMSQDIEQD
jgi:hypothetical protein